MLRKVLIGLAVTIPAILLVFGIVVALQPSEFRVTRSSDSQRPSASGRISVHSDSSADFVLGEVRFRQMKFEAAVQAYARALELDPTSDAVAYGYNAVANLNLHRLSEAEKSALKASEIDRNNSDPRVHFLLAQIYEAKRDPANEAAQLREYLKFASDPSDAAMVKQYLADLEKRTAK